VHVEVYLVITAEITGIKRYATLNQITEVFYISLDGYEIIELKL